MHICLNVTLTYAHIHLTTAWSIRASLFTCTCPPLTQSFGSRSFSVEQKKLRIVTTVTTAPLTCSSFLCCGIIIIIIYPLTARVVGAPQTISQPVSSIFRCSPSPSGTWRTPGPDVVIHFFLCLPCLLSPLPPFTVPCKMVLARHNGRET